MATITSANLGNGNGSYTTDIVVKDLDMTVSNYVKDRTPITNMAMSKKRKVNAHLAERLLPHPQPERQAGRRFCGRYDRCFQHPF